MKKGAIDPRQDELAFSAVKAHALFPGRTMLYVGEVAVALSMSEQQVIDLIEDGHLKAVDISSQLKSANNPHGNRTPRAYWRIPVSAFDAFVIARKNV